MRSSLLLLLALHPPPLRRVSSLLWGSLPAGSAGEGRLVRVAASEDPEEAGVLWVLTSSSLQRWQLGEEEDRLCWESEVAALAREAVWASAPRGEGSAAWLRLWLMDLSVEQGRVSLLLAAVDQNSASPVLQYGVASLRTSSPAPPLNLSSFTPLPGLSCLLGEGEEPRQHRLVTLGAWAYCYNREGVTMAGLGESGDQERISSHIMGAGRTDAAPLFFSSQHGVVSLGLAATKEEESKDDTAVLENVQRLSESLNCSVSAKGLQDLTMSESLTDQLKAAFLQYCKRSHGQVTGGGLGLPSPPPPGPGDSGGAVPPGSWRGPRGLLPGQARRRSLTGLQHNLNMNFIDIGTL